MKRGKRRGGAAMNPPIWVTNGNVWGRTTVITNAFDVATLEGVVPQSEPSGNPQVLGVVVDELDINVGYINSSLLASNMNSMLAIGVFLAEWDENTTNWSMQDPWSVLDACRKDWIYMRQDFLSVPTPVAVLANGFSQTTTSFQQLRVRIKRRLVVAEGSAIRVVVSNTPADAVFNDASLTLRYACRYRRRNAI